MDQQLDYVSKVNLISLVNTKKFT